MTCVIIVNTIWNNINFVFKRVISGATFKIAFCVLEAIQLMSDCLNSIVTVIVA